MARLESMPSIRHHIRAATSALVIAATALGLSAAATGAQEVGCAPVYGTFGGTVRPAACWRPYSDTSPFNQVLPASPRIASGSAAIVSRVVGFGPLQHLTAGDAGTTLDAGRPMYFSAPTDPLFTVHCTEAWGTCAIEGDEVRIPDAAQAAGGEDAHLTVVDQATGLEVDMWHVSSKPAGGGQIDIGWGGSTQIDGEGLGSDAVAARTATMAGVLRAEEMQAGRIDHALAIFVHCDAGKFVFPATKSGLSCAQIGLATKNAPPMGSRLQLNMTDAQIAALNVAAWRKPLLLAMAHYGMYVIDTGGTWGVVQESALSSTSFGAADPWTSFATTHGANWWAPDARWAMNIRDGIDWASKLRVIDPCVAQRTC
jgi:hypothetical protein